MTRIHRIVLALLFVSTGCDVLAAERAASDRIERQDVVRDLQRVRARAARERLHDRAELHDNAKDDLVARTATVRDERADLDEAARELSQTVSLACDGAATPDGCPIADDAIASSTDDEHGLVLHLREHSGTPEEVRRRIECYRARASLDLPRLGGACIVDLANSYVAVEVGEADGHVVVDFAGTNETILGRLRSRVRELLTPSEGTPVVSARN